MAKTLEGRSALVTGGNRGIGLAIAHALAEAGADVAIWGRDRAALDAAAEELASHGGRVHVAQCDVSDESAAEKAFEAMAADIGAPDAVFANAGTSGEPGRFLDLEIEEWRRVLRINLEGAIIPLRLAARGMIERGSGGALVGIGSIATRKALPKRGPYMASKHALVAVMNSLAVELARYGIRANTLHPGWTATDMTTQADERLSAEIIARTPARRWGTPRDVASAAVFLADPAHAFHTGDQIVVDGAYTLY